MRTELFVAFFFVTCVELDVETTLPGGESASPAAPVLQALAAQM
jgi:hypothetical protein